jgi:hypothetical protein
VADFTVPADILASGFDVDRLVEQLLHVDRPILVSAGPLCRWPLATRQVIPKPRTVRPVSTECASDAG